MTRTTPMALLLCVWVVGGGGLASAQTSIAPSHRILLLPGEGDPGDAVRWTQHGSSQVLVIDAPRESGPLALVQIGRQIAVVRGRVLVLNPQIVEGVRDPGGRSSIAVVDLAPSTSWADLTIAPLTAPRGTDVPAGARIAPSLLLALVLTAALVGLLTLRTTYQATSNDGLEALRMVAEEARLAARSCVTHSERAASDCEKALAERESLIRRAREHVGDERHTSDALVRDPGAVDV